MTTKLLILGAGHAGGSCAAFLRQYGFEGEITIVGDEPVAPYQRPPLSKAWLKGEADSESLLLRPLSFYEQEGITLRLEEKATAIDRGAKTVSLAGGDVLAYDTLVLAIGARARPLAAPGADLEGVLSLRTAADADALKAALQPGARLAVVGGGYVGLEAAASARALGCEAVVLEREARLLARVASAPMAAFFLGQHQKHGVQVVTGASVVGFEGRDGRLTGVRLADGGVVDCDAALVGIGAIPNVELALAARLDCPDGVAVDIDARTADSAVYAIGDVTWRPMPLYDRRVRLESVPNALEQARRAACAIVGRPAPTPETPWFWSDQYDLKLQIAGLPVGVDRLVCRGDSVGGPFSVFRMAGSRLVAVEAVNAGAEFMGGRQFIGSGVAIDAERLADPTAPMKSLIL